MVLVAFAHSERDDVRETREISERKKSLSKMFRVSHENRV